VRLGTTTVTSWSGQTRGGWTMVPAKGPFVDGGWYEGTPRFVDEDVGKSGRWLGDSVNAGTSR
jgi:hypothetical protein